MNTKDTNVSFEWILNDLAEMYKLELCIDKNMPGYPEDTWNIWLINPATEQKEQYSLKKVNELNTYDKAASMALNIMNDAVRRIFYNSEGCSFDGKVNEYFKFKTGY